jgi:signal transduction histidine kinase
VLGDDGGLVRFVHSGIDEATVTKIGHFPEGRGVLGALVKEARPLRLREVSDHPQYYGFPPNHPHMHSFLGVPIIVRERAFGRLYITEKRGEQGFTKDDERIALTFAAQAGVAIENARLYDEVLKRGQELSSRVAQLASVERVGDLLITGHTLDDVLESVVDEARKLTDTARGTLLLLDGDTGELVVRQASGAHSEKLLGVRLAAGSSKAEAVMRRGRAEVVDDLRSDSEVHQTTIRRLGNPKSGAFAPLIIGNAGIGSLAVYERADDRPFTSDELAVLQVLANQAAIAVENDRLTEALRDMAVLEERERISKELHDGVIQAIYSVGLSLQGSISLLEREPSTVKERIDAAIVHLDNVVRDVRSYIFELQPKVVEEHGVEEAIRELVKELELNTLASTDVEIDPDACDWLTPEEGAHVVMVAREVLSNIARHARAGEVWISCFFQDGRFVLSIADDGVGFDPDVVVRGQGLKNMEERARRLNGEISITARRPKGTEHTLRVPVEGSKR